MYKPRMANPSHPGEILLEDYLKPLNLTVTAAAEALGVVRKTLSDIVNCKAGISTEMALRLALAFDTTPESWLNMQLAYDLARAVKQMGNIKVKKLAAA
jgi:antitoxin HigA-1